MLIIRGFFSKMMAIGEATLNIHSIPEIESKRTTVLSNDRLVRIDIHAR